MSKLKFSLAILFYSTFTFYTDSIIIRKNTFDSQQKLIQFRARILNIPTTINKNNSSKTNKQRKSSTLNTTKIDPQIYIPKTFFLDIISTKNASPEISKKNTCITDKDCGTMGICVKSTCHHKGFFPINGRDILGIFIILICSILASSTGIGGGSLLTPFIIYVFGFDTHEAIPLSKLTVFATCLVSFFTTLNVKNPKRDAFALDYNVAGIILPNILFGTSIGITLNKMLPSLIILIGLIFVLLISTYKSFIS